MIIRIQILGLLCFMTFVCNGQKSITDLIEVEQLNKQNITEVNLHVIKGYQKTLVEKIELNNKHRIKKLIRYCDFLYKPLDEIDVTVYKYDKTNTLLIGRTYLHENGDTIRQFKYSYIRDSLGILIKKGIKEYPENDYEEEVYQYDELGHLIKTQFDSYNKRRDSIWHSAAWVYNYHNNNLTHESFMIDGQISFERIYGYDSRGNLSTFNTKGQHQCGDDISRYKISYNSNDLPILKEYWNASGENWAKEFKYNKNNKIIQKIIKTRYPKHSGENKNGFKIPPPPPFYTQDMLEENYSKDYEYNYIYDLKGRLIKVLEIFRDYKTGDEYILEYK